MMSEQTFLTHHFLIATPALSDPSFFHAVAYICEHSENGAIGIVINRPMKINLSDVLEQMSIENNNPHTFQVPILLGGPVHQDRGFVIHRPSGNWRSTFLAPDGIAITTSRDILQAIAQERGPEELVVSLGCAGWQPGQLEQELGNNFWLTTPFNTKILFETPYEARWQATADLIGVNMAMLSDQTGHA